MQRDRRHARILAMQALCQWEIQRDESREELFDFLAAQQTNNADTGHAARLVETYWTYRDDVDQRISSAATRWELPRISPVERNTMRVAVTELLLGETPVKVALDEAIEIGREYGGAESPRFINGVLDKVLSGMQDAK